MEAIFVGKNKFIVANFKMNKTVSETEKFLAKFVSNIRGINLEIAICPNFLCLEKAFSICHKYEIKIGAQNCYFEDSGAFTGEISALMLSSLGAEYVILGHSERRNYFFETDEIINKKVKSSLKNNLKPIICIGETAAERKIGKEKEKIKTQIDFALKGVSPQNFSKITIAYEPIWAIGTGETVDPQKAEEIFLFIKNHLICTYGEDSVRDIRLLYGGSVNENNAKELLNVPNVDGGLIGGASLDFDRFLSILKQLESEGEKTK